MDPYHCLTHPDQLFSSEVDKMPTKNNLVSKFFADYFLKVHLHPGKKKKKKRS